MKSNRNKRFIVVMTVFLILLCFTSPRTSFAVIETELSDTIIRFRGYSYGTLLYDSALLEPRYGPGLPYASDFRFDLKEGEKVRVFSIASDEEGNQWVLAEGMTSKGLMRAYILYYEESKSDYKIEIENPKALAQEFEPDYPTNECMIDDVPLRTGPGSEYLLMETGFDYDTDPVIIATNNDWVLVEYTESDEFSVIPRKYRGWVPFDAVLAY